MIADPHEIQRLRYTPGQDLLSRDFRDQAAFDEQLRWWHNRAMHGAFGVRSRLKARLMTGAAEPTVEVEAGLAYDCFGRELILPAPRTLQVPAGPQETAPRVLVIRYREDGGSRSSGGLAGVFCGEPASHGADLLWLPARRLRPTDGVPLARVVYEGGDPSLDVEFHPPVARALARPRLGRGSTVSGATAWSLWSFPIGVGSRFLLPGLEVRIDTRAAGFTRRPCYFAWLQGAIPFGKAPLPSFQWIEKSDEETTGFRFRLFFNLPLARETSAVLGILLSQARQRLSVCWLGIQPDDHSSSEVTHEHA